MEEKILYSDPDTVKEITVTGWVSKDGRFWGENEHMARWSSCTHLTCECGNEHTKGWTVCDSCRQSKGVERYNKLKFKEWDKKQYLYSNLCDEYFYDDDSISDYCEDNDVSSPELMLVICEPNYAHIIDDDYWDDDLPEDTSINDVAPKIGEALDALNKLIMETKPILSWSPGKLRTTVYIDQ